MVREGYIYLLDAGVAFVLVYLGLWLNDALQPLVSGSFTVNISGAFFLGNYAFGVSIPLWFHHWMFIFAVPLLVVFFWLGQRHFIFKHVVFTLIVICMLAFFSQWALVSPVLNNFWNQLLSNATYWSEGGL